MGVYFAKHIALEKSCDELWLVARREEKLNETKHLVLQNSADITVRTLCIDLDGKTGALFIKSALQEYSPEELTVSILVNNAGFGTYGEFCATDVEREMQMVSVNCTALTGIIGYALPYMKKGSRLINTASLASFMPLGNFAVYAASKAFVLSLTVSLAAELKDKGIIVTALCPGPVSTEFANVASKGARKEVLHGLPAEKTVIHCLAASRRKKRYAIMAFKWKLKAFLSRFVGRYAGARFTYLYCKRPSN